MSRQSHRGDNHCAWSPAEPKRKDQLMSKMLKITGLALLAVLALGAASAASAQALPIWTVEGVASGTEAVAEAGTVTKVGSEILPSFDVTVASFFRITCSGFRVKIKRISIGFETASTESLALTGCKVLGPKGEATVCLVKNVGGTNGTILTGSLTSKLTTKGSLPYEIITPVATNFVEIRITECALEGTYKVTGSAAVKILTSGLATSVEIESNEAIAKAAETKLLFGSREAFLNLKVDTQLVSGKKWGIDP